MKRIVLILVLQVLVGMGYSQSVYKITYHYFRDSALLKQDPVVVFADGKRSVVTSQSVLDNNPRNNYEETYIINKSKEFYKQSNLSKERKILTIDSKLWSKNNFELTNEKKKILDYNTKKATTSINSNPIDVWYTNELKVNASPNNVGINLGLVLEYRRNGNSGLVAAKIEKLENWPTSIVFPDKSKAVDGLTYQDLIWKMKFIQIPIFNNEQICFQPGIASDSVLRFAEGTVLLKKVKVPQVDSNSQVFLQLVEKSNGDAYDRTGSVFLISEDQKMSFVDGMKNGMKTLPKYDIGDAYDYLGMTRTDGYSPIYELMRFFTPFGVNHFNNRLQLKGKEWQDSVVYRQDISEFLHTMLGKEVYIGTYIGNYDKGGHKVSLELTIHPGESNHAHAKKALSLFNTTNVMEMGGQTYATLFGSDQGLTFEFELKEDIRNVQLRYITTGHGGWENGDEFVPKVNSIYLDDKLACQFTPWRVDCGSYRLYNPVSGNFSNGLSSSDLSRSNWCPGTITYPNYIALGNMKAGKHKIKVHIPQGPREGDSFSFWNVSGALIFDAQ